MLRKAPNDETGPQHVFLEKFAYLMEESFLNDPNFAKKVLSHF